MRDKLPYQRGPDKKDVILEMYDEMQLAMQTGGVYERAVAGVEAS
ncbi:MAG: hypothetical protein ACR2JC_01740 [Chloroflexota bacterium]